MFFQFLRNSAIAGNIIFVLWILNNGINEGFQGTAPQVFSYIVLILLLSADTLLHFHLNIIKKRFNK